MTARQFLRRPDRDTVTRVQSAAQALLSLGVDGEFTRRAEASRVSRVFVYTLVWQVRLRYELAECALEAPEASRTAVDRHLLVLRLEGPCALERLAHLRTQVGRPVASVGEMSPRLAAEARALPHADWRAAQIVFLVWEEMFTRGQPMLLTVAPRSRAMLQREVAAHRAAAPWKQPWEAVAAAGLSAPPTGVSDQGAGVVKGWPWMGLPPHPAVLHRLRPLAICGERFSRKALAASAREEERGNRAVGRAAAVITQRRVAYAAAQTAAEEPSRR